MRLKAVVIGLLFGVVGGWLIRVSFALGEPCIWEVALVGLVALIVGPLLASWGLSDFARRDGSSSEIAQDALDLFR